MIAITLLAMLYVLSSGPILLMATTRDLRTTTDASGREVATAYVGVSDWWQKVYSPLVWVAEQSWGEPLSWYWGKFFEMA